MILNNKKYLVKFPDPNRSTKLDISYINNVFSEYIGTKIFKLCDFATQKVVLGIYKKDGKEKIVCGCEDFTDIETKLVEFEKFENASIEPNPFKREIKDIFHILESGVYNINLEQLKEQFWNMFIIDSLIGNIDRHKGNWGFLKDVKEEKLTFAPIYDCGSCLFSTYTDEEMEECLRNNTKMQDCNNALKRIYEKINLDNIFKLINNIEVISDIRKQFYCKVIKGKYKEILTVAYKKLNKK